jgi:siderophore synthetase component
MAGKSQTFSKGQREEIISITRQQLLHGTIITLTLLTGITGLSLWGIKKNVEKRLEVLVAAQFDEPKVQQVVEKVASNQAKILLERQVQPEVSKFKSDVSKQLSEVQAIVTEAKELKKTSDDNAAKIAELLTSVQESQRQATQITSTLTGVKSDLVKVERGLVEIQYFTYKGRNQFPNPFHDRIMKQLNELLAIAMPDPAERAQFVRDIEGYTP